MQDAASFLKVYLDKLKKYTHFENLLNPNQRERETNMLQIYIS